MSSEKLILYEIKRKVAKITLNRPEAAHAFNWELMKGLFDHLIMANENEGVKCIVLKSSGDGAFSSGIDIKAATPDDTNYLKKMRKYGRKVTESMLLMKKPIISVVQGTAIGFGFEIIMASDLKLFADKPIEEMFFRMPEIAIGIYPQTGATILPLISFGLNFAKKILFTADKFGIEDLKKLNFPTRIFPADELGVGTKKFIRTFSKRMESFMFLIKSSLTIMNNKFIKQWYDLEDECGQIAYEKNDQEEIENYIKSFYKKYP